MSVRCTDCRCHICHCRTNTFLLITVARSTLSLSRTSLSHCHLSRASFHYGTLSLYLLLAHTTRLLSTTLSPVEHLNLSWDRGHCRTVAGHTVAVGTPWAGTGTLSSTSCSELVSAVRTKHMVTRAFPFFLLSAAPDTIHESMYISDRTTVP